MMVLALAWSVTAEKGKKRNLAFHKKKAGPDIR